MTHVVVIFDLVALLGFIGAVVIPLTVLKNHAHMNRLSAVLIMLAMGVMVFVSLSNLLESSGMTGRLDVIEDYVEVLVFPILCYAFYAMHLNTQVGQLKTAMNAAQAEHALLVRIVDSVSVAILFVNDVGCVLFANRFATEVLGITEADDPCDCPEGAHVFPVGEKAPTRSTFHGALQKREIEGEKWELIGTKGQMRVGVIASPLEDSSGKAIGSVVVLARIPHTDEQE